MMCVDGDGWMVSVDVDDETNVDAEVDVEMNVDDE